MDCNTFIENSGDAINSEEAYNKKLSNFMGNLGYRFKVFDEVKKQTDRYIASDFNVFDFIRPDENRISDIVADLLRPNGAHGQGSLFGRLFLDIMSKSSLKSLPSSCSWDKIKIYREYATAKNRRIDILMHFEKDFALGIENKPWASDQPDQIEDYVAYLKATYNNDNFVFIYLSPNGEDPTIKSIKKTALENLKNNNQFASYSFNGDIVEWLKACREKCEAEKVRIFIKDFMDYIAKNFQEDIR